MTPLGARPRDWFFVLAFAFFAFTSAFSDAVVARGIALAPDSPHFWARANWWYAQGTDPLLLRPPTGLRVQVAISAFVFGPFYLLLVYAFVAGKNWIRMPAIVPLMRAIRPCTTATSALNAGRRVPSTTVPPRITRS